MADPEPAEGAPDVRAAIVRDAIGVGVATGAYALSFGALSTTAGLSVPQTCALSLLMFTGASQFALIGILGGGGTASAAAATAVLLGGRNALYGLRLSSLLGVRGARRAVAAQFVIDESTAMALGRGTPSNARLGFWSTGIAIFTLWNAGTLIGALSADLLSDPKVFGLDAAVPAAFVALLAQQLRDQGRQPWMVALLAALVAIVTTPFVPIGVPVLCAAVVAVLVGLR